MFLTERLLLRPFDNNDVAALAKILEKPAVLEYFPPSEAEPYAMAERVVEQAARHWELHDFGPGAVELVETGQLLGRAGLQLIHDLGLVEIDYLLGIEHWQKGYATEAAREWIAHGFSSLGLQSVVGLVHEQNHASARVLEKIGMSYRESGEYFGMPCKRYEIGLRDWAGEAAQSWPRLV